MKKLWRASDSSTGMMYDIEGEQEAWGTIQLAEHYGHAEGGEIIHIWNDENTAREPDAIAWWDSTRAAYTTRQKII